MTLIMNNRLCMYCGSIGLRVVFHSEKLFRIPRTRYSYVDLLPLMC